MQSERLQIAIVRLSALGDVVQASVVLQFIKNSLKGSGIDCDITWIVDERFAQILEGNRHIANLVAVPLKARKFFTAYKILKSIGKFHIVIDLQGLLKSAMIASIIGKKRIHGFDKNSAKEGLASLFYTHKFKIDYNENIVIRNLSLAAQALKFKFDENDILDKEPCLFEYQKPFNQTKRVLIAPFASEESKCYDKFKEVIKFLLHYEIFVCFGNEKELEKAQEIVKYTHAKVLKSMDLKEMVDFISGCDLVIGNDSGITHIAWAQNVPSITLFGNRPSRRNAYETKQNVVIDTFKKIDARKIDKNDFCIREIRPEIVINMAKRLLDE